MAAEQDTQTAQVRVESYHYALHLDIANVVAAAQVPGVCNLVPVQLTYDDSNGDRHVMEYLVIGNGCTN